MRAAISRAPGLFEALTPLQSLLVRRWRPQWICQDCQRHSRSRRDFSTTPRIRSSKEKPYYITTPIFYVNADPHVGHMYTMILTDVIKRWQELKGRRALMCTGTDEHGLKIQQAAAKAHVEPKLFCDKGADVFRDLANCINVSHDVFIRTTDCSHRDAVEYAWHLLSDSDYIYEAKHEGWYSVSDETFYPKTQVQLIVEPETGRKIMTSKETGKEVEWTSERNYRFRLSAFQKDLLAFYAANPDFVVPRARMKDVIDEVSAGLEDLSISRPSSRLTWGIPVPTDSSQTIYVWLDALLSYATAAGFPFPPDAVSDRGWPADVHVVGKDIVRFHCIYWPAFLMALQIPLPKQVLTHAHWTLGRQKMAKSTGNVVSPFFALERFGVDPLRWYLVHEGGITHDADYSNEYIHIKYKKGLQSGLGNLVGRITLARGWDVRQVVERYAPDGVDANTRLPEILRLWKHEKNDAIHARLMDLPSLVDGHMRDLMPNRALQVLMQVIYEANEYLQFAEPWAVVAEEHRRSLSSQAAEEQNRAKKSAYMDEPVDLLEARISTSVYYTAETLRLVGIMLQPFIPDSSARLLDMLGVDPQRRGWDHARFGCDGTYGDPRVTLHKGEKGALFPAMPSLK